MRTHALFLFLLITRLAAPARAEPDPMPAPTRGVSVRTGLGPSLYIARVRSDGETFRLVAPGADVHFAYGRRFRDVHALEPSFTFAVGPAPTIHTDNGSGHAEGASYIRAMLGLDYTRFAHASEGRFITLGVGAAFAELEAEDISYIGVGGYGAIAVGREWAVARGWVRVGVMARLRFEGYRTIDANESTRGASLSVLFTVGMSAVGVDGRSTRR